MKRSEHICGVRANERAFVIAQKERKSFVVGAYPVKPKNYAPDVQRMMYAQTVFIGKREKYQGVGVLHRTRCPYRVIVTPKRKR